MLRRYALKNRNDLKIFPHTNKVSLQNVATISFINISPTNGDAFVLWVSHLGHDIGPKGYKGDRVIS